MLQTPQSVEDSKIKTTDNKGEAVSTGSELYIDKKYNIRI